MLNIEEYLNNYYQPKESFSLNAMNYFIKEEYGNFQKDMRFIHVAGTNGKGSVTEIMSNILKEQGYIVGQFLSPHLTRYNERIKINNIEIKDQEFSNMIEELEPKIVKYNKKHEEKLSLFELICIIALLYFYRKHVDFVVLEVGLRRNFR